MSLALQLHLVIMSNYSKFGVDTYSTFWVMGYIKVLAWQWQQHRQQSSDHNSSIFSSKQNADELINDIIYHVEYHHLEYLLRCWILITMLNIYHVEYLSPCWIFITMMLNINHHVEYLSPCWIFITMLNIYHHVEYLLPWCWILITMLNIYHHVEYLLPWCWKLITMLNI